MIFEIGSTVIMSCVAAYAYKKTDGSASGFSKDTEKLSTIFKNAGWIGANGETIRIHKKRKIDGGMEYVYQLPLGFDRTKIENNKHILEDGLNVRSTALQFDPRDLLKVKWDKTILKQIKTILTSKKVYKKEIEIEFDGMLKIRVYNETMKDSYQWDEIYLNPGTWAVTIGITRTGKAVHDFDKDKHLIVCGSTGFGKSVALKLIVTTLVMQKPDHAHLHLFDLKGGSAFHRFKDMKQVKSYERDPKGVKEGLIRIQEQMQEVYTQIVDDGFEDIKESGIKDRHFIIIDEAADIADDGECMGIVTDIARRGRGAGFYLVYATQYPSAQSITQQTKRNIPVRLSYVLDDAIASNTALGQTGAELLPMIPGRGLYKNTKTRVIQTPYISNKQIQDRIAPHIIIRPREDEQDGPKASSKTATDRQRAFEFEKV